MGINNMVLIMKKMKGVIFLLMMFASTAFAAGRGSMHMTDQQLNQAVPIMTHQELEEDVGSSTGTIHERLLRVNAKDYGNYDPSPTFAKPPYKLIPN